MNDSQRDFSCSSLSSSLNRKDIQFNNIELESSLESSSNFFDKNQHHFSTSSEISFINPNIERLDKNPLSTADYQLDNQILIDQSEKNIIHTPQSIEAFEQVLQDEIQHQQNTSIYRRRNSLKDLGDNSSTSSDEGLTDVHPKLNRSINNNSSWHRESDVYTSDSSDENNNLLLPKISYSIQLKPEIDTSDEPLNSTPSSTKKSSFNFIESLSERISIENKHPDTKIYFIDSGFKLKEQREILANKLLLIFNQDVFNSQLSRKVSVVWSSRLTATARYCTTRRHTNTAVITLSIKICDSPERCRDTLLHEMCHAAVTLIDGVMEHGHGSLWKKWTEIVKQIYPYLPPVSIRHTYDVVYKFIYRCVQCQYEVYRHSKSLNVAIDFCGKCMGRG